MVAAILFAIAPRALVSDRRIAVVLDAPRTLTTRATPKALPTNAFLAFDTVEFRCPGAAPAVLIGIRFTTRPGEVLGIIGATGSGKSTLLGQIVRLRDMAAGCINLGGVDLRDLDPKAIWAGCGSKAICSRAPSWTLCGTAEPMPRTTR